MLGLLLLHKEYMNEKELKEKLLTIHQKLSSITVTIPIGTAGDLTMILNMIGDLYNSIKITGDENGEGKPDNKGE